MLYSPVTLSFQPIKQPTIAGYNPPTMSNAPKTDTAYPLPSILHDALAPTIDDASVNGATELGPVAVEKGISSTTLSPTSRKQSTNHADCSHARHG
jgi:hypothetical protein